MFVDGRDGPLRFEVRVWWSRACAAAQPVEPTSFGLIGEGMRVSSAIRKDNPAVPLQAARRGKQQGEMGDKRFIWDLWLHPRTDILNRVQATTSN